MPKQAFWHVLTPSIQGGFWGKINIYMSFKKEAWFSSDPWGLPIRWQGWLAYAIYVMAMILGIIALWKYPAAMIVCFGCLLAGMVILNIRKSENYIKKQNEREQASAPEQNDDK